MEFFNKKIKINSNGDYELVSKTAIKNRLRRKKATEKKRKARQESIQQKPLNEIINLEEIHINMKSFEEKSIREAIETRNLLACNKLISTFGQAKKLSHSLVIFKRLIDANIYPSVYTLTSLVNSCVRCGEIERAKNFIVIFEKLLIPPNEVTFTALIKGLCSEGMMQEAFEQKEKMIKLRILPNLRTYNTLLRGCLRNGFSDEARILFNEMIEKQIQPDVSSYEYLIKNLCQNFKIEEAWSYAMKLKEMNINQPSTFSAIATAASLCDNIIIAKQAKQMAIETLKLNEVNTKGKVQRDSADLFIKLKNQEVEKELESIRFQSPVSSFNDTVIQVNKLEILRRINFQNRFHNKNPIKLEVCSGHGEWVVERALQDKDINWLSIEIRFERVFQIWSKSQQKGIRNLIILCGEACDTLKKCIKRERLDEIFVNYPDPPIYEQSKWLLISEPFLRQVHRVLQLGRSITVVTDDRGYANKMIYEFSNLKDIFNSEFDGLNNKLPKGYGSSYFDRFWLNGNKSERYFLKYSKI